MKQLVIFGILMLLPFSVKASADLSINAQDIRFSEPLFVAGDTVRIYTKIYNIGDEDVSGYVSFYQGSLLIDDSLVISLPANGNADEVYVDFIIPERSFNILALIRGTDPADGNISNDSALTSMFTPIVDEDRDGIENKNDNCPNVENNNQKDTDNDSQGDECDEDDDGDGLSDDVEEELGINKTQTDSDSDGVEDAHDAYPNSDDQAQALQKIVEKVVKTINETTEESVKEETVEEGAPEHVVVDEVRFSPNAVFAYTQDDWNTFTFSVLTNAIDQAVFRWDFADGVSSSKPSVRHVYTSSGTFPVTLTMIDESGVILTERITVLVPFFHLQNRVILAVIVLLIILLLLGVVSYFRLGKKKE